MLWDTRVNLGLLAYSILLLQMWVTDGLRLLKDLTIYKR